MSLKIPPFKVKLSPMVENMAVSKTIQIHALTKDMEKNNETVYSLCVGEPDYPPPAEVLQATGTAAALGNTKYTAVTGEISLRNAIVHDLQSRLSIKYTPEQIVVSNGAKQAVIQALMSVVSPGDEVLIPAPYWTSYPDMVKMCNGAKPVIVQTSPSNGYILTPSELRSTLSSNPRISCIIICNPSNPTGSVATREQLTALAEVLHDFPSVIIIADEIYERLVYDVSHTALASLSDDIYLRTVTINGFSKSHSMTGYRIGYSASGSVEIAKAIAKIQSQVTSCASSISQYAATKALETVPDSWMHDRIQELKKKRDLAYGLIMDIPHVTCPKPNGAFYLLPDVSHYFNKRVVGQKSKDNAAVAFYEVKDSHELCLALLKEEQVAVVSGDAFGAVNCLRLSYATSEDIIVESLTRLKKFLLALE